MHVAWQLGGQGWPGDEVFCMGAHFCIRVSIAPVHACYPQQISCGWGLTSLQGAKGLQPASWGEAFKAIQSAVAGGGTSWSQG
jgi:hypothetical protein